MPPEDQDRVMIVLVRARNPSNIGASARAMHDLGFSQLRIVNEFSVPFEAALATNRAAVDASSVLNAAQEFPSVADAVADCSLVLGTSAVGERVLEHPLHLLPEAATNIRSHLTSSPTAKVALLFGSEKTGLSNDELSHCHALVTVPMNTRTADRHLSMNLGQAVAVCLYAITQAGSVPQATTEQRPAAEFPATAGDLERLTTLLREVLADSGYARRHPANCREEIIRRLARRMMLTASDAPVWTGILRQIQHALASHASVTESPAHSSHEES
jgi:TrmH family RNA methyltransferase